MPSDTTPAGHPVTVLREGRLRAAGLRFGEVVAYDWVFEQDGREYRQRSFVLLAESFAINQPAAFPGQQRGWWYCDLVRVRAEDGLLRVDDWWIDVVVGPPDHPYRLLDLDEFGAALASGRLSPAEAAEGLARAQRFLDRRLNRRHDVTRTWPAFPPVEVEALLDVELPLDWQLLPA